MKLLVYLTLTVSMLGCGRANTSTSVVAETASENTRFWPVTLASDSSLNTQHPFYRYYKAAAAKELPLRFFRELIQTNANVVVRTGTWPRYKPGMFSGGTIEMPGFDRPELWGRSEWSNFYNELFHAWWGNVWMKSASYNAEHTALLTEERKTFYKRANPGNPRLAQEEGYSETIAALMIYIFPTTLQDGLHYQPLSFFPYNTGKTVNAVSHGDQPGYKPEAEDTYMNPFEYDYVFRWLTTVTPPKA